MTIFLLQKPNLLSFFRGGTLIVLGYFIALEDLQTKTIKNEMLKIMLLCWVCIVAMQILVAPEVGITFFLQGIGGFLICGAVFLAVYLLSHQGLGGGDVKFMAVAGLFLGVSYIFIAMIIGTTLASVVGIVLIITKKMDRKTTMPLAPFLYIGILCAIL